jgi:hypothetical protein
VSSEGTGAAFAMTLVESTPAIAKIAATVDDGRDEERIGDQR